MSITRSILVRSVASAFLALGMPAQAEEYDTQTFEIAQVSHPLGALVQSYGSIPDGTLYLSGKIFPEGTLGADGNLPAGATSVGEWFSHGFVQAGYFASTDVYRFANGQIVTSQTGRLDASSRTAAITGGTKDFKGASGEARLVLITPDIQHLAFRVTFFE
jgi:hypothetical protein